jgi:bifunctional non-homologous end joining protein LigD
VRKAKPGLQLCEQVEGDGATVFAHACALGCEGIVSKRKGSRYSSGRSAYWLKTKNPDAPAVARLAEEDWS